MHFFVLKYLLDNIPYTILVRAETLEIAFALIDEQAKASKKEYLCIVTYIPDTCGRITLFIK